MAEQTNIKSDDLSEYLGQEYIDQIAHRKTKKLDEQIEQIEYTNLRDITCECETLILRSNVAKLILPTEPMIKYESRLNFLQYNDGTFKNLRRGCYWLVDDMYKFEHIGFSKKLNSTNHNRPDSADRQINPSDDCKDAIDINETIPISHLRYLVCADCNLGPLGWHDSNLNESYLYVW